MFFDELPFGILPRKPIFRISQNSFDHQSSLVASPETMANFKCGGGIFVHCSRSGDSSHQKQKTRFWWTNYSTSSNAIKILKYTGCRSIFSAHPILGLETNGPFFADFLWMRTVKTFVCFLKVPSQS